MKVEPTILVVDDELNNIKAISRLLMLNDYHLLSCSSGAECLEMIPSNKIDLVLMDIMMPDMDGHETCAHLRELAPKMPVIMMTALMDDAAMKNSFHSGAVDFIRKPINETELLARIGNMLKIKDAEKKVVEFNMTIKDDLAIGAEVQSFLLPDWVVANKHLTVSSAYEASQTVSGDLYDVIAVDDTRSVFYVGDISGHGVQSALLMTAVEAVIKMLVKSGDQHITPSTILNNLNSTVSENLFTSKYMTILMGVYNASNGCYRYFNAGHPPIIEYNLQTGNVCAIEDSGSIPIGWMPDVDYLENDENQIILAHDCLYLLYTDGLFECADAHGKMIGLDGILELLRNIHGKVDKINLPYVLKGELEDRGYELKTDDFTLLSICRESDTHDTHTQSFMLPPQLDKVPKIGAQSERALLACFNDPELAARTELVINEYLNNVIIHGLGKQSQIRPSIIVTLQMKDSIQLTIYDRGTPWVLDENDVQEADKDAESGRGLMMIQTIANEFSVTNYSGLNQAIIKISTNTNIEM